MSEKEAKLESIKDKRTELIKEINNAKYENMEISEKDKKANDLYHNKIVPNFKFEEDFYYNLAMKYKTEIENNEFSKIYKICQKVVCYIII
jgi:chloramphenicol O-acetyltransferase